jgi:hypothetical protein
MEAGDEEARQYPQKASEGAEPQDGADQRRGTSRSAITATRGSSSSALCALGPSAASNRAATPPTGWQRTYAAVKAAKEADQDNFIFFFIRVNKAAGEWLDTLTAPEVPSQDDYDPRNPCRAHDHRDRPEGGDTGTFWRG